MTETTSTPAPAPAPTIVDLEEFKSLVTRVHVRLHADDPDIDTPRESFMRAALGIVFMVVNELNAGADGTVDVSPHTSGMLLTASTLMAAAFEIDLNDELSRVMNGFNEMLQMPPDHFKNHMTKTTH